MWRLYRSPPKSEQRMLVEHFQLYRKKASECEYRRNKAGVRSGTCAIEMILRISYILAGRVIFPRSKLRWMKNRICDNDLITLHT